jgi:hypothetical protein
MERVRSFDLFSNPFCLLRVEPTATLDRIADAYDDAVTDRVASEAILLDAREALVNPRQRTSVELTYLIDTPPGEVGAIFSALRNNVELSELLWIADWLAPISKANLLVHAAARQPASADLLYALVDAHARFNLEAVQTKLTGVRRLAGLIVPSIESVKNALHDLLSTHSKAALAGFRAPRDTVAAVEDAHVEF